MLATYLFPTLGLAVAAMAQSAIPPPSQDPFYAAPSSLNSTKPGEILRIRTAPGNLTSTFGNASSVHNIVFRTTDTNYQPSYAWTTLFVPKQANSSSLLSYQIPYNTPDVDAGPSSLIYGSISDLGLIYSDIQTGLSNGWYVNVPDFEGPEASFFCGVQEGHATLDSIRAVHTWVGQAGSKVALWGYSGGSFASGFAIELQVQYAPDLKNFIAGAVLGGIVPSVTNALANLLSGNGTSTFAGLIPAGLVGFATQHPDVEKYLLSQLLPSEPYNASTFLSVKNMSIEQAFTFYAGQNMSRYFQDGAQFFNSSILSRAFARDATMSYHGNPEVPVYVYKAVHDEISFVQDADALVQRYCTGGSDVVYERNSIGGHLAEETNGDARALEVLGEMLSGKWKGANGGCVVRDVSVNVTDSAL